MSDQPQDWMRQDIQDGDRCGCPHCVADELRRLTNEQTEALSTPHQPRSMTGSTALAVENAALTSRLAALQGEHERLKKQRRACACSEPDPVMQADGKFYCHRCSFETGARLKHLEPERYIATARMLAQAADTEKAEAAEWRRQFSALHARIEGVRPYLKHNMNCPRGLMPDGHRTRCDMATDSSAKCTCGFDYLMCNCGLEAVLAALVAPGVVHPQEQTKPDAP